ncbi:MAG: hypothetical protein KDD22_05605, partial [Bdellovibrionales bacterium]|nr:hypothetical protein [Bdellovibrionales bacterium]
MSESEKPITAKSQSLTAGAAYQPGQVKAGSNTFAKNTDKPMERLAGLRIASAKIVRATGESFENKDWVNELKSTLPQRQGQRFAKVESWVRDQNWAAPNKVDIWKQKIQKPAPTDQGRRILEGQGGSQILVAGPGGIPSRPQDEGRASAVVQDLQVRPTPDRGLAESTMMRPLTIAGFIQMQDGLAYLGSQTRLEIHRVLGGQSFEKGTVKVSQGQFEIYVKEPKGYLVAELLDRQGQLLGRGTYDLYKLPGIPSNETRVAGILLNLEPRSTGTTVATLSVHSLGGYQIPVDNAVVEARSQDVTFKRAQHLHATEDFIEGSTALLEAESDQTLPTLEMSQMSSDEQMIMVSPSYMKAIVRELAPFQVDLMKERGFILGRVMDQSVPAANAIVELAGDYSVEIVYFNDLYIPDRNLKSTSSNGMFVAVLVPPSIYSLRAQVRGVHLPAKILPVEAGKLTQALFDRREVKSLALEVRPFPANSSMNVEDLSVSVFGDEAGHRLKLGTQVLQYHEGRGVFTLEAFVAGESTPILRTNLPHGVLEAALPLISQDWISDLAVKRKVNIAPMKAVAFGLGADEDFEVIIDLGEGQEDIVY